ncbi:MAG: DUF4442 domain-containing protein [Flavobacteriaceae bacterium]|nr:DUF4442 domain-containing protein [Flavobacteriaceae bacterium]
MKLTPKKINFFTLFKLPSCYFSGVRVKTITAESCTVTVKHRWINQNPFKSMFWAVQGMAAELSTGALVMGYIKESGESISMLVANNKATFSKKATGKITFTCHDGLQIKEAIAKTVMTGEGQTCWMTSIGKNKEGVEVSRFQFEWTLKSKT